jgi:flagellar basal body-associated protein FliL
VTSLEKVADQSFAISDTEEREPFYDNLRMGNHLFLVPKMVVNLKKSARSSDTPMGAFEFYVEGTNQDVLIEIKDREVELRDLMYRTLESFNFEQADSPDGKELICEKLRKELNAVLSQGKIRKVWLKTAIVKP